MTHRSVIHVSTLGIMPAKSSYLASSSEVAAAFRFFETNAEAITEEQIRICSIPASPFGERERAEYLGKKFSSLGLTEVRNRRGG